MILSTWPERRDQRRKTTRIWTPTLRFLDAIGRLPHRTLRGYQLGCPCLDCRIENLYAQRAKRGGPMTRLPSERERMDAPS